MRESRSSGSVGEQGGNDLLYPDIFCLFTMITLVAPDNVFYNNQEYSQIVL